MFKEAHKLLGKSLQGYLTNVNYIKYLDIVIASKANAIYRKLNKVSG